MTGQLRRTSGPQPSALVVEEVDDGGWDVGPRGRRAVERMSCPDRRIDRWRRGRDEENRSERKKKKERETQTERERERDRPRGEKKKKKKKEENWRGQEEGKFGMIQRNEGTMI